MKAEDFMNVEYNEYMRKWRHNNPEKVKETKRKYRENHRDKYNQTQRNWTKKNREMEKQ